MKQWVGRRRRHRNHGAGILFLIFWMYYNRFTSRDLRKIQLTYFFSLHGILWWCISLAQYSGTAIGNLTMKRFWFSIKKQSISNVTYVTRNCTRDPDCQYTACRYLRPPYILGTRPARPRLHSAVFFLTRLLSGCDILAHLTRHIIFLQ